MTNLLSQLTRGPQHASNEVRIAAKLVMAVKKGVIPAARSGVSVFVLAPQHGEFPTSAWCPGHCVALGAQAIYNKKAT